jgi:Domain of unknown function (DUF4124)
MRYFLAILISFLLFAPSISKAAVYRWQDEKGNVGFTDNPENIPDKYRDSATLFDGTSLPTKPDENTSQSTSPSTGSSEDLNAVDDNGHDEQWWRERIQELHHRKELLLAEKERLTNKINPLGNLGLGSIETNREAKEIKERLEQINSEIETIENDLNVLLPEEARKANAPPGWLRE